MLLASTAVASHASPASIALGSAQPLAAIDGHREAIVSDLARDFLAPGEDVAAFKARLNGLRADQLLAASLVSSRNAVEAILATSRKVGASGTQGLLYTPIFPCRLVDTRGFGAPIQGGPFAPGERRSYVPAGRCSLPTTGISALMVSMTTQNLTPNSGGYIALVAPEAPVATTTDVFNIGAEWSASNATVAAGTAAEFDAYVANANAHLVVDVLGYFAGQAAASVRDTTPPQITVSGADVATAYWNNPVTVSYSDDVELAYRITGPGINITASPISEPFADGVKSITFTEMIAVPLGQSIPRIYVAADTSGNLTKKSFRISSPATKVKFGTYQPLGNAMFPQNFSFPCGGSFIGPINGASIRSVSLLVGPFNKAPESTSGDGYFEWNSTDGFRLGLTIQYDAGGNSVSSVSSFSIARHPFDAAVFPLGGVSSSGSSGSASYQVAYDGQLRVLDSAPARIEMDIRFGCNTNNGGWSYGPTTTFQAELS